MKFFACYAAALALVGLLGFDTVERSFATQAATFSTLEAAQ